MHIHIWVGCTSITCIIESKLDCLLAVVELFVHVVQHHIVSYRIIIRPDRYEVEED
jgi:hypothetical protein